MNKKIIPIIYIACNKQMCDLCNNTQERNWQHIRSVPHLKKLIKKFKQLKKEELQIQKAKYPQWYE